METIEVMTVDFPPVETLIPHEGAMVMLDEIVEYSDDHVVCLREITSDALFAEDGCVPATVSIEYMAQTIAAYAGYSGHQRGEEVQLAFLLSCRELTLDVDSYQVGDLLEIEASPSWIGDSRLGSFCCEVRVDGRVTAEAQLNVYQGSLESVMEKVS